MKQTILLLTTLFYIGLAGAQSHDKDLFKCLPCGNDCDKTEYTKEGKCTHCGMKLVPASTISFTEISPSDICDYITQHPQTLLLDVRTKGEYEGKSNPDFGTLKGAINIPIQELGQRLTELETYKDHEIVVICSHSRRSPQAAYLLTQNGFKKVINMAGGMSTLQDKTCKK